MKKPLRKIVDYLILTVIFSCSIVLVLLFNGNPFKQIVTIITMSILYVLWGIVHHLKEKTFYPKIVLEYALYGLLGSALTIGLII